MQQIIMAKRSKYRNYFVILLILFVSILPITSCQKERKREKVYIKRYDQEIDMQDLKVLQEFEKIFIEHKKKIHNGVIFSPGGFDIPLEVDNNGRIIKLNIQQIPFKDDHLKEINKLSELKKLSFQNTTISSLKNLIGLNKLETLYVFCGEPPRRLGVMNKIISIPKELNQLFSLSISNCEIENIEFSMGCQIEKLSLDVNKIKYLNSSFRYLQNLKKINVKGNLLEDIDLSFLSNLKIIELEGNPIKNIEKVIKSHPNVKIIF